MPNHYEKRVQSMINMYRANPHLFNDSQLDELQELANVTGIKFSPIRQEFNLRKVVEQASSGFLEGLTTIPVGKKPRTTYESIAHSLGHLVGFAPGIMAAPIKLSAKGAAKLGAKGVSEALERGATLAGRNLSVPMLFGDWVKKGASKGLQKSKLESFDFLKRGAKTRGIAGEALHLGAGMSISSVWGGPDAIMQGFVGGAVAGGMFGGLGNFNAIGNLLKSKNVIQHRKAEQTIKAGIGAAMLGGPAYMRGEPVESVLYETILGGYFGYKARPTVEKEGGKFIQDLMYYPEKNVIFTPEKHPDFNMYSKGAKEYIMDSSTQQARTYLKKQYPDIKDSQFDQHFRSIAENDIGPNPTKQDVESIMRQEATQHYFGNWEYVKNPFERPNKPQEPSYEQQEDITHSVSKPPKTTNLDVQKQRYEDKPIFVVEMDGSTYTIRGASGEYRDSRVGDSRVDRPSENFQGTKFTEISGIYQPTGGRYWRKFKPLATKIEKGELQYEVGKQDWWRIDNNLDRQDHYIYGGVKDKGVLNVKGYHIDTGQYSVEQLNRSMGISKAEYRDSLELEAQWYGKSVQEVKDMHDRKWKSNILSEAEEQGFYVKGSGDVSKLGYTGAKNVTDWNKRQQLFHDKGLPLPKDTFGNPLRYAILNDLKLKDDIYTVRDKDGNIVEKYNESNTDGTILFTPEKFKRIQTKIGLPSKKVGMNKPVVMFRHGKGGILMGKAAGAVAEGPMLDFMLKNNLDMIVFDSAAKQRGNIPSHDYSYSSKTNQYESQFNRETDVQLLDPTSIRMNLGTFENPSRMYGTHFVRQFLGNLNEVQTSGSLQKAFDQYYIKSYEGTKDAREAIDKFFKTGDESALKNIDINDMPLDYIHRIYDKHYNTKAGELIRNQIYKLDKQGALEEVEKFTKEEYRDYLARNDRIMNITGASESATKLFKHTRKYSDKVYKKYMIQRLLSPKYKYSAKSWLSPKLPHVSIKEGTFKAGADFNPDVIVNGKEMKLKKLWSLYEKNPEKYKDSLDFAVIRVPADSVSGTRVLKFDGFVGKEGTSILTRGNDNTYLGGADKDSDTVFLYQGLDKSLLGNIKKNSKEWQREDGTWIEGKSNKYETLLRGERDTRFEHRGSQFSPAMRMIVARNAAQGNQGLGFTMTARNTMISWIDMLSKNNGQLKIGNFEIKLKNNGSELRRLAREMINTSADAANYPNVTDFTKWRDHLFNTTFDATINGKKAKFSDVVNKTELGTVHKLQNVLDPKGINYKTKNAFTLDQWQVALKQSYGKLPKDAGNTHSLIARKIQEYGIDKPLKMESVENYHKILLEANKRINAVDEKDRVFVRKHLTKLIRVPIGRDISSAIRQAEKTGNWENVLDFISNDTFMVASNNAIAKKGLEIYRALRANGVDDPTGLMDGILTKIAVKSTEIKNKHENLDPNNTDPRDTVFKNFDAEIESFKADLLKAAASNKIKSNLLTEYFDIWMISPYNYGTPKTRSGASRLSMQSQMITEKAWREVMTEFEGIYQNINKRLSGEKIPSEESAIFKLPADYKNAPSKEKEVKSITDLVVYKALKTSPLKKQETSDRVYTRKALGEKDYKELETFEQNMQRFPGDPNRLIQGWTLEYSGRPKSVEDLTMLDVKALNRYFKDIDNRFKGDGLPSWIYWADPRSVDEAMWHKEKTFYRSGYNIKSPKGGNQVIYKGVGTLGTIRNWFRQTNRQMDIHTDAIPDINNDLYKFRTQLTPNESQAIMYGILSKIESNPSFLNKVSKKHLNQKYMIDGRRFTYQELVDKYSKTMANDLESFGKNWIYSGENIDSFIRFKKDGSFDEMNFIRKAVTPGDRGGRIPIIPLETIYRFQYEYKLNRIVEAKELTGKKARDFRESYKKKNPFKGIEKFDKGNYFPHLGFGWNKEARKELGEWIMKRGDEVYQQAIDSGLSEKDANIVRNMKVSELEMKIKSGEAESGGMDKHAMDDMLSRLNYKELSLNEIIKDMNQIGFDTRPENILSRAENLPGYDKRASVIDAYKEKVIRAHYRNLGSVMANFRIDTMIRKNPFGEFSKSDYKKYNPDKKNPYFNNWTEVWADYLKFYVRDAFGHPTTFSDRIVKSIEHGDPLRLGKTMYKAMSDQAVIKGIEKVDKQFKKFGVKTPFLGDLPQITAEKGSKDYFKQVKARQEYLSNAIHNFGRLEARYELLTLLANTGTLTANMFGGTSMNISSAGLRNFIRVNNFKWLEKNVLFDRNGNPTLKYTNNKGKEVTVRNKKDLYKWIQDKGVIDNFINDELQTNIRLKDAFKKTGKSGKEFIKDLKKLLKENPDARNETVLELARRYGVQDTMLKFGGAFMQVSERKLRRDAFLTHVLQAKDKLGLAGKDMSLNDPYLVDAGLKGVEATQFLYHSAFRPAFMRTSFGKVMTRFKLFAFQSIRTRKELERRARYYGYKKGTKDYENMKDLFTIDMLTMALGSVFMYSLFDTALPPPYDYLQETSQWLFGDKAEREKAFFGTYPRPIAPLQIATPPAARVIINPIKSLINNDWERFMDYHIHTMYPFGRIVRQVEKTVDEPYGTMPGRFMQQFFRLPADKVVRKYNRAQLEKEREQIISRTLGT